MVEEQEFGAREQARQAAVIKRMLADRDRRRPVSREEFREWRDEGRL